MCLWCRQPESGNGSLDALTNLNHKIGYGITTFNCGYVSKENTGVVAVVGKRLGVVNVADGRIPEKQPENGIEGEMLLRADSASKERAATAGITLGVGKHLALRLEGLSRKSDLYKVPGVKLEETVYRLPDSNNKSHVGTVGLSYVGEKGYLGAAYSYRNDDYGVVGHNHMYDPCSAHIFDPENRKS